MSFIVYFSDEDSVLVQGRDLISHLGYTLEERDGADIPEGEADKSLPQFYYNNENIGSISALKSYLLDKAGDDLSALRNKAVEVVEVPADTTNKWSDLTVEITGQEIYDALASSELRHIPVSVPVEMTHTTMSRESIDEMLSEHMNSDWYSKWFPAREHTKSYAEELLSYAANYGWMNSGLLLDGDSGRFYNVFVAKNSDGNEVIVYDAEFGTEVYEEWFVEFNSGVILFL